MSCIFCQIIKGKIPSEIVYRNQQFVVFKDIKPKARVHFLIMPKRHLASVNDLEDRDVLLAGRLLLLAKKIAQAQGLVDSGYQLRFHVGRGAGQEIDHLHCHLLAD